VVHKSIISTCPISDEADIFHAYFLSWHKTFHVPCFSTGVDGDMQWLCKSDLVTLYFFNTMVLKHGDSFIHTGPRFRWSQVLQHVLT
jgi:hypothetical protein